MDNAMDFNTLSVGVPYNLEAEQSVLGAILLDSDCLPVVMELMKIEYFYNTQHREIYGAIIRMFTSGTNIDFVTVLEEVKKDRVFDGDEQAKVYLTQLAQITPSIANVKVYCNIVEEKYLLRSLLKTASDITSSITDGESDPKLLLDSAEQKIFDIRQDKGVTGLQRIDEIIVETYDRLQRLSLQDKNGIAGIPTGFGDLDRMLSGLNKSDLILLAARPGMGKTSFALNIATNVALKDNKSVAIFSLEMGKEQLVSRVLSSEAAVSSMSLRNGQLTPDEWVRLAQTADTLSKAPIYIDDTSNVTVADMKAKLRRVKDLGLVVIDYLQLMSSGTRNANRVQEVSEMTRNLKIMARELNVPVITLSQLSRGPESRIGNHRPMLSDLRESGSIEQDADIVMFLYRDAYYNKDSDEANVAECIVAKNRHGEVNTVRLNWDGMYTRFSSLEVYRHEP